MTDVNLNSGILRLQDFPKDTTKIQILYDERGWAIRCYSDEGTDNKITTMVPDDRLGENGVSSTLVRRETL